jgi:hypothetical protein
MILIIQVPMMGNQVFALTHGSNSENIEEVKISVILHHLQLGMLGIKIILLVLA